MTGHGEIYEHLCKVRAVVTDPMFAVDKPESSTHDLLFLITGLNLFEDNQGTNQGTLKGKVTHELSKYVIL